MNNIRKQTYGINFPFKNGNNGDFLNLTDIPEKEIKANLVHLLLTRKGSRYFLPDFGTNIYQYIFEPLDEIVKNNIETEINEAVNKYIPNLKINKIIITQFFDDPQYSGDDDKMHTVTVGIDYTITSGTFQASDIVTLTF
jgi:phage baseplate assembly protein W